MQDIDKFYDELMISRFEEPTRGCMWWGNYIESVVFCDPARYWAWYIPKKLISENDIVYRNREGKIHRLAGPAYINRNMGSVEWWKEGKIHRTNGPAIICKQLFIWAENGKLHNIDGPAIVDPAGPLQYWIDGIKYSPKQFKKESKRRKENAKKSKSFS